MKLIDHWFWSAFLENKQTYYKVMLAATLVNFMSVGSSIFIMVVYDRVLPNSAYESLYALTIGMALVITCLLYTSPSPRDMRRSRMPSSA